MQPISWVEAVDADEDAIEALRRLKRYRRPFLPVVEHDRLLGIVDAHRILKAARSSRSQVGSPAREGAPI
jgi:CBS domain-containing protein